jgi:chromosome segregation protein
VYLKSIELVGFKSFPSPTTLDFEPGVTIIVGPNGCGKSNVSDAIRWVLGEQSAKLLRGRKMEDLIFNGSAGRKPVGMAEVALSLGEVAETLGDSPYGAFEEVKVSRRLYRDDTSDYRLNETPCRLKDIVELFLESGLATNAFTVIEQGKVAGIVSSKPEDRRLLIEQAAGVMKYKHKRAIAQRKLEAAKENLLRVTDIVEELSRQLERLKRQAQRARRYQALNRELRGVELTILADEFFAAEARDEQVADKTEGLKVVVSVRAAELSGLEGELARLRLEGLDLERTVAARRKERLECEGAIDRSEHRMNVLKAEREQLADEGVSTDQRLESLRTIVLEEAERVEALEERGRQMEESYQRAWGLHELREAEAAESAERLKETQGVLEPAKALLLGYIQAVSRISNEAASLDARRSVLEVRREQLLGASRSDREALERVDSAYEMHTTARQELSAEHEEVLRKRAVCVNQISRTSEAIHSVEDELNVAREALSDKKSMLVSLESIQRSFEGYKEGVRYLMERQKASVGLEGIRGVVAEVLECPPDYEVAIEAALGERVQSLVVDSHSDARAAIDTLKQDAAGRSAFIPLRPKAGGEDNGLESTPGLIGPAVQVVTCREEFRPVVEHLLDGFWLVEDFDSAIKVWDANGHRATLVTLDGVVLEPSGLVVGGSANDGHLELLKKRRLVKELSEEVSRLRQKIEPLEAERASLTDRRKALEADREALDAKVTELEKRLVEVDKTLEHLVQDRERISRSLEVADAEAAGVVAELEALEEEQTLLAERLQQAEAEKSHQEAMIAQAEGATREANSAWEAARELVHEQSLVVAGLKGERETHRAEQAAALQRRQDLTSQLSEQEALAEKLTAKGAEVAHSLEALESELQSLYSDRGELVERLKVVEEELASHQDAVVKAEEAIQRSRVKLDEAKDELNGLEVARAEVRVEISHIADRVRREWRLASPALVAYHVPDGPPIDERRRQADELRRRLRNLGGVNLEALAEFEEVEARHSFLTTQKADLERSIEDLTTAIEKINRTTRRMMRETFDAVNTRFREVFSRLFEGGSAELFLTDTDILEAGVDISVQPPGKRLGSITLMSSGEKALTALALLFAMFLVKPAPFCVLDEVDAALDDANIKRFTTLLKELSQETQFIVITHNKQTMVQGDILYGITMEEEGVSRMVSLNLEQASAHAH